MTVLDWFTESYKDIKENGVHGIEDSIYQLYLGGIRKLNPLFGSGTNIYERDWDLLIVIDGCRTDAIAEVADEYSFLDNPGAHRSTASTSWEWMKTTFVEAQSEEIENTVYVSANHHSSIVEDESFLEFEDVFNYGWDDDLGTIPAETVTDVAIETGRRHQNTRERMIVHYMQPHFPSVPQPLGHGDNRENVWHKLRIGALEEETVWRSYLENLRYVLDHVESLLANIDAEKVVISSDHGNAKGEWGVYEHPHGLPLRCLRVVPWYTTTATDSKTKDPDVSTERSKRETDDDVVKERLRSLGYRTE